MGYRELLPHAALRPYVDRFWARTPGAGCGGRAEPSATRILPDGCIDILIDIPSGAARVVGTMTRAALYTPGREASIAAVRSKPGGARAFLRMPVLELTDCVVTAEELGLRWLDERRTDPSALPGVLSDLQNKLLERVSGAHVEPDVQHAVRRLFAARAPSIAELTRELGQSRQQLARSFRRALGISPKELGRVARLQRAVDQLQRQPATTLAAAALDLGYYDQAHMARDFRLLGGITPDEARRSRGSVVPIRSLWLEP